MSGMQKFMESCLLGAAKTIERTRKGGLQIKAKGRNDMATSADFASERLIARRIRESYPDSLILSEESFTQSDLGADSLFVIDPIDGTHNFIAGIPLYGISIAHYSNGKPTAGGTYVVPSKMLFYAEKGGHSTLNGRRISVSRTGRLEDFFFLCDSRLHSIADQGYLPRLIGIERLSQHTRFLGCAIYEMGCVACGIADAVLYFKLKPYDFAAAAFIVEQAGGRVTDFSGRGYNLSTKQFIASNGKAHQRIVDSLSAKK